MTNDSILHGATSSAQNKAADNKTGPASPLNRRNFVKTAATAATAFTIVPRPVLGGKNVIAPSDKITLAYIGIGTQGIRELLPLLATRSFR
jgi:hypothetical protein